MVEARAYGDQWKEEFQRMMLRFLILIISDDILEFFHYI